MSEFSSSFHIRTDNPADTEQRLRRGKVSGLVFGPANRWLTFVPYANLQAYHARVDPADFAADLSRIVGLSCPPLSLRRGPRLDLCSGATAYGRKPVRLLVGSGADGRARWMGPEALSPFARLDAIEPLLQTLDRHATSEKAPAYRFAELMGLPAYKWLSPELAQERTVRFSGAGRTQARHEAAQHGRTATSASEPVHRASAS